MAVERRRGCGFRKVGGTYLVSGSGGWPCDRLPIPLGVCPRGHAGIKQSRGWTWIDVALLVGGVHRDCTDTFTCPLCMATSEMGKAGLLWIGERFYPKWQDFEREGAEMGLSRRISAIPRNFKLGETWVLLAHPKVIERWEDAETDSGIQGEFPVTAIEKRRVWTPAIFHVWRPERIERICRESERGSQMVADLVERGITPVFVPDDDPDHRGSVYDDDEENGGAQ